MPEQTGELEDAEAAGEVFTATVVDAWAVHPFMPVTVRVYIPAIADAALAVTTGLWALEVNPFGPVQE